MKYVHEGLDLEDVRDARYRMLREKVEQIEARLDARLGAIMEQLQLIEARRQARRDHRAAAAD